jgi:GNAT superfamily N-acetyltransferase
MHEQAMDELQIEIAPAQESDLPGIAELAEIIWQANYRGIISEPQIRFMLDWMYALETLRDEVRSRGVRFERLLVRGSLAGFAAYGPTEETGVFKLHKLYVHPNLQGKGLGSRLLEHCERAAARLGAHQLILSVNKRNHRAQHTYERNGYKVERSVIVPIGGGYVMDDYVMAKSLESHPIKRGN